MELVKGIPITKYCDDARLTIRERVELFIPVCRAVQHAHTKGIIHRDLKPSNILVALYDAVAVPKVIDFGVAKALHQKLTDRTMVTEFGAVIGTPEYMAPEQAEFNALDIDTRADVYSLGVILYELLSGSPPFDRRKLQVAAALGDPAHHQGGRAADAEQATQRRGHAAGGRRPAEDRAAEAGPAPARRAGLGRDAGDGEGTGQ